jgi:hypothetical protein
MVTKTNEQLLQAVRVRVQYAFVLRLQSSKTMNSGARLKLSYRADSQMLEGSQKLWACQTLRQTVEAKSNLWVILRVKGLQHPVATRPKSD